MRESMKSHEQASVANAVSELRRPFACCGIGDALREPGSEASSLRLPLHSPRGFCAGTGRASVKDRPSLAVWVTRSTAMGVLAALTGAGGVLPLFLKEYIPAHKVVGTTVAGCLIMSIPAAATYYAFSGPPARCGSDCLGPIFLPGMFAAGIASSLAAPFGAWLSHALQHVIRRRAFSALLLIAVLNILVNAVH